MMRTKQTGIYGIIIFLVTAFLPYQDVLAEDVIASEPQQVSCPEENDGEKFWSPSHLLAGQSSDPIEGFNRSMFFCTDALMTYVAKPVGCIWATILPKPVIDCIENACKNLAWPGRLISSLGCAEWECAGVETVRFLTNTTIGIAGLFDPAKAWFGFYQTDADFDRMFTAWGIQRGCRLTLPLTTAVNVREASGNLFDALLDIRTYLPYSSWAYVNNIVAKEPTYDAAMRGVADPYRYFITYRTLIHELERTKWFYEARKSAGKGDEPSIPPEKITVPLPDHLDGNLVDLPGYHPLGAEIDTLRSVYFKPQRDLHFWYMRLSLFNRDFAHDMSRRKVSMDPDRPSLRYGFWDVPKDMQESNPNLPEQLAILMPGIDGIYDGNSTLALAEIYNNAGYKVVTLDNALNWRFSQATDGKLAGYVPHDVKLLRQVIRKVLDDLLEDEKISQPRIVLAGWSMGGLHTLFIASMESEENTLGIDRYVAMNPPADLLTACEKADAFMKPSMKWSYEDAIANVSNGFGLQYIIFDRKIPPYDPEDRSTFTSPPLVDSATAGYFIAAMLQFGISDKIMTAHKEAPFPNLADIPCTSFHREQFYQALADVGFNEYVRTYLMYQHPGENLEELNAQSGLYAIRSVLENNPDIAVLHAWDDILLSNKDRAFLDVTLQKKITWFPYGGHCGQFYTKPFQDAVLRVSQRQTASPEASEP